MTASRFSGFRAVLLAGCASLTITGVAHAQSPTSAAIDIPAGDLAAAINRLAAQSGQDIAFKAETVRGKRAPAIKGNYTAGQALERLLASSGLAVRSSSSGALIVEASRPQVVAGVPVAVEPNEISQITVVGSNIRGASSASPVIVFDKGKIAQTGAATLQQFFEKLPQNFGGGANAGNVANSGADRDVTSNWGAGSGVNLRGLGTGTTLTLLNGRRLTASNQFQYVDISLIPLSAVERVEVLTDGASAIYGSDAIGGVVNIVLRKDFDGLESRLRYGSVTQGGLKEYQVTQTAGLNWQGGHALLSYEYLAQDNLKVTDKDFSRNAPYKPYDLYPQSKRHSLYGRVIQDITPDLSFELSGIYANRKVSAVRAAAADYDLNLPTTKQYDLSAGLKYDLPAAWQIRLNGAVGNSEVVRKGVRTTRAGASSPVSRFAMTSDSRYVDLAADGPLYSLPGGQVRLALGATYRKDEYENAYATPTATQRPVIGSRKVGSLFAEAVVPIVGEANRFTGVERLEATLAARYDDYSDFGSTVNPKIGLAWEVAPGFRLRGTYGTSFRAPIFEDLQTQNAVVFVMAVPNATVPAGRTILMVVQGGSDDLGPEKASTWTGGVDLRPTFAPKFALKLNYYRINYTDRIDRGLPGSFLTLFAGDTAPYAPILNRSPSLDVINQFKAAGQAGLQYMMTRTGPYAVPAELDERNIEAILDNRVRNNAATFQDGIDFDASYDLQAFGADISLTAAGQYILSGTRKVLSTSQPADVLNQAFLPVDFKFRTGASFTRGQWSGAAALNYTGAYKDLGNTTDTAVEAWKTVDLDLRYTVASDAPEHLRGTSVALNIQNLFDSDPPYVVTGFGSGFDPVNANPLGRFASLTVTKQW